MVKKILFLSAFLIGFFIDAQVGVTGIVIDSDTQKPIPGINISIKDHPETAVFSNENGHFYIETVPGADSLKIVYVGYVTKYVSLKKENISNLIISFSSKDIEPEQNDIYKTIKKSTIIPTDTVRAGENRIKNGNDTVNYVKVTGRVINSDDQQPISDANVILKGTPIFVFSDENGNFELEADQYLDTLQVEVDDMTKYIPLKRGDNLNLTVNFSFINGDTETGDTPTSEDGKTQKKIQTRDLDEVVIIGFPPKRVKKKENPAFAILRELWKRKKTNGLTNFDNYQYKEYEKIEFDLNNVDSTFISKKIFKNLDINPDDINEMDAMSGKTYIPVFINESISEVVGQNQPTKREKTFLQGNRASGIPNNDIVANTVKNLYKDVDIYNNTLNFFNKGFTSPVATTGFEEYEYLLADTLDVDGTRCFHIKYRPLRANELTFKGDLYISEKDYAVKSVTLQSSEGINVNFVNDIYMELEYDIVNDSIFVPLRNYTVLDMSLLTKKEGAKGMFAKRTFTYEDYKFDKPQGEVETLLNRQWEPISQGAYKTDDEFWSENRPERLEEDDKKAYELVDRVSKTRLFRNIVDGVEILSSGYINVGNAIDIGNLYQSFGFNDVEGVRLRAGARTYFTPNDMWRLEGYTAYGFKDDQFKYGGEGRVMFNKYNRFTLGAGTKRDITQMGVSLTEDEGIMTRSFASSSIITRGDNNFLSSLNKTNVFLSIEPWKNVQFRLDGSHQYIKSANPGKFDIGYYDKDGNIREDLYDSHLTFSVMLRPGAKYSRYGLDRYEHSTLAPTIILKYIKGFEGVINSDFKYDELQFLYSQPILWGPIGKTNVTFQFGKSFNKLPLSLLSIIPGNQSYGIIPNTFGLLNYYDFVTDIYSTLDVEHHFNGRIFSYIPLLKKLQLREVVFVRGAWGDISDGSKAINASNIVYVAPNKDIYYEYGFGIENIGLGNLRIFRVDFNWRGNYFDMPDVAKFGIKVGMQFTF